jgi:hypothetical protein
LSILLSRVVLEAAVLEPALMAEQVAEQADLEPVLGFL